MRQAGDGGGEVGGLQQMPRDSHVVFVGERFELAFVEPLRPGRLIERR
ncbi:MAG: hypothetical protein R3E58_14175 [Phycisphaerae bacterium]